VTLVGIAMGSTSDLPVMERAGAALDRFGVPYELRIISAHRTPHRMVEYGRTAAERGLRVLIAGAGGSAHLPGMLAVETSLPVLAVAVERNPDPLNSALGSMVRMPEGAPLATLGKNEAAAWNAGLLAVRILALADDDLRRAYEAYVAEMADRVAAEDGELRER
jgi:phosphoribosylaminoimidazole carboxylase PurE protein